MCEMKNSIDNNQCEIKDSNHNNNNLFIYSPLKPIAKALKHQAIINQTKELILRLTDFQMLKGKEAHITELEIVNLCNLIQEIFLDEKTCLDITLNTNLYIVGDLYGQYTHLLNLFNLLSHPPNKNYLFLGNYINRGDRSIETMVLLLAYKLIYPQNIYLLRGNHECEQLAKRYGFYTECSHRYSQRLWKMFITTFDYFPICAIINKSIFCTHSGISPCFIYSGLTSTNELINFINLWIPRPTTIESNLILTHLLWSDPDSEIITNWEKNPLGLGYLYNANMIEKFCNLFQIQQIIRSNEYLPNGYEFFINPKLLTIFFAPNYMNLYKNNGAIIELLFNSNSQTITGRMKIVKPIVLTRGKMIGRTTLHIWDSKIETNLDSNLFTDDNSSSEY